MHCIIVIRSLTALRHDILGIRKCDRWLLDAVSLTCKQKQPLHGSRESGAKSSSYATEGQREETNQRGSLSLNKDTTLQPHGLEKQTWFRPRAKQLS